MNEEHRENEIDDIFRQAIEPVNTEPSDKFWRKAAENIIAQESKLNQKRATRWRAVAFILGAGLLMLGFFAYENGNKNLQNKNITNATIPSTIEKQNITISPIKSNPKPKVDKSVATVNRSGEKQRLITNQQTEARNIRNSTGNKISNNATSIILADNKPIDKSGQGNQPGISIIRSKDATVISDTKVPPPKEQPAIAGLNESKIVSPVQKPDEKNNPVDPPLKPSENKTIHLTASNPYNSIPKKWMPDSSTSRFSLSAFFSPEFILNYEFKCSDSKGSELENSIKTEEKQNFSYTLGAKVNYQLSSRFLISTGIAYQVFSFNIDPGIVYAQKQSDGEVGYYITTSSGVVKCPYYYGTPAVGDSLKMTASSSRTYLEIPLDVKYYLINKSSCKFYISAGIETNICMGEKTIMNWQDFWYDRGVALVTNTEGEEHAYLSYSAGIGADFKISERISFYAEPELHDALTSLDDNISVTSYPRLFSATAGLTYNLK